MLVLHLWARMRITMTNILMILNTLEWGKQGHQMILTLIVMVGAYPLPPLLLRMPTDSSFPASPYLGFPLLQTLCFPPAPLSQNSVSSINCPILSLCFVCIFTFELLATLSSSQFHDSSLSLPSSMGFDDNLPFTGLLYSPLRFRWT